MTHETQISQQYRNKRTAKKYKFKTQFKPPLNLHIKVIHYEDYTWALPSHVSKLKLYIIYISTLLESKCSKNINSCAEKVRISWHIKRFRC